MSTYNFPNMITPFKFWCNKVLPLTYDDSLSYYELLCKLVNQLNEDVIPAINNTNTNVQNLYKAFNELKTYVSTYFNNLDVQDEINKKLDEMAQNGTLENIVEPYLNALTTSTYCDDVMLAVFHDYLTQAYSDKNSGSGRTARFYIGTNGADFCEFNKGVYPVSVNTETVTNGWVGAPSICYHNGLFIMTASGNGITTTRDGAIGVSENLTNWKWFDYTFGVNGDISDPEVQAPHIFEIGGKLYLIESCWTGAFETNIDGTKTHQYQMWLAEVDVSTDGVKIGTPSPINLPDTNINHIDGLMIQLDNTIYLLCVNDSLKTVEVYSTVNMTDFTVINKQLFGGIRFEGITATIYNGVVNLYADHYATTAGAPKKMYYGTTKDFLTVDNVKTVSADYKYQLRHGDVITINNASAKKVLRAIDDYNSFSLIPVRDKFKYNCNTFKSVTDDSGAILYKEIKDLYITPECEYHFPSNYDYRITNLHNLFGVDSVKFVVSASGAKISITNSDSVTINYSFNNSEVAETFVENTIINFATRYNTNVLYPCNNADVKKNTDIAFLGDSITAGAMASELFHMIIEKVTNRNCYNWGLSGAGYANAVTSGLYGGGKKGKGEQATFESGYSLKTTSKLIANSSIVVVFAGTNDYRQNVSEDSFRASMQTVLNQSKARGKKIIVCTPTHRQTETANTAGMTLENYVDIVKEIGLQNNAIICDLYTAIPFSTEIFPDGLHPNNTGHNLIAKELLNYIR